MTDEEIDPVEDSGTSAAITTKSALGGTFATNLLLGFSMSKVWETFEGL